MIVYIASFPRSGNTLTRNVIKHYFGLITSSVYEETDEKIRINWENLKPDEDERFLIDYQEDGTLYRVLRDGCLEQITPEFRRELANMPTVFFLKTHEHPFEEYFPGEYVLHVIRHPAATIWSYYNYQHMIDENPVEFEEVIKGTVGFGSWSDYTEQWRIAAKKLGERCFKLKFEDLIEDKKQLVQMVQEWTGLEIISEFGSFPEFDDFHKQSPQFFRKGKADEWKQHYSNDQFALLLQHHGLSMLREGYPFNYLDDNQEQYADETPAIPAANDYVARIELVKAGMDQVQELPRVPNSGEVIEQNGNQFQITFNGVRVPANAYYGKWNTELIRQCKGHHEPQEEYVFHQVIQHAPEGAVIIEFGSYWAFYSTWFLTHIKNSYALLVEPNPVNLPVALATLNANNVSATIELGAIGSEITDFDKTTIGAKHDYVVPVLQVDELMERHQLKHVYILHCDIQGAEAAMLAGAQKTLLDKQVDYIFISTHGAEQHEQCIAKLQEYSYRILADHNMAESYSFDGLIVACSSSMQDFEFIDIKKRRTEDWIPSPFSLDASSQIFEVPMSELERMLQEKEVVLQGLLSVRDQLHVERDQLRAEYNQLHVERDQLRTERDQLHAERDQLRAEYDQLHAEYEQLHAEHNQLHAERDQLHVEYDQLRAERDQLHAEYNQLLQALNNATFTVQRLSTARGSLKQFMYRVARKLHVYSLLKSIFRRRSS